MAVITRDDLDRLPRASLRNGRMVTTGFGEWVRFEDIELLMESLPLARVEEPQATDTGSWLVFCRMCGFHARYPAVPTHCHNCRHRIGLTITHRAMGPSGSAPGEEDT